jgi:hypothetical protein
MKSKTSPKLESVVGEELCSMLPLLYRKVKSADNAGEQTANLRKEVSVDFYPTENYQASGLNKPISKMFFRKSNSENSGSDGV